MSKIGGGMSGGRNVGPGFTRHRRRNVLSDAQMRRMCFLRVCGKAGHITTMTTNTPGLAITLFAAWALGGKILIDGLRLTALSKKDGAPIFATLRVDNRQLAHSELVAAGQWAVDHRKRKIKETGDRLKKLDAELAAIGARGGK